MRGKKLHRLQKNAKSTKNAEHGQNEKYVKKA